MEARGKGDTGKGGQRRKGKGKGGALLMAAAVDGDGSNGIVADAVNDNV